ncbi:FAD-dependent monooxygenase [Xenorhabdus bovienii]|uniref:FAD-dependent monooxygenase n=1 Tax=Xenorhabdus bovienii TaxID=40576 RepID=UPI001EE0A22A|nr:FAD-dependent monooxygenase [Xenorhabdus bovienii]MCG3463997.1 FAD-dependent monooxygenase [Xenorhabdus bovienii]
MNDNIIIIGAGVAGLTLALAMHSRGMSAKIFESVSRIEPLGVGINIQPYATKIFHELGLLDTLISQSIITKEMIFFNKHGQKIHSSPLGKYANNEYPQISIHRGILQQTLLNAVKERLGYDAIITGKKLINFSQENMHVKATFINSDNKKEYFDIKCEALIGADGIHSRVYETLYPNGPKLKSVGVHMWRGITIAPKFLTGESMVRVGIPEHGKLVIYPIKDNVNFQGDQLINWVAEIDSNICKDAFESDIDSKKYLANFFASRKFDWLDISNLIEISKEPIISMPMMDRDPLLQWQTGLITLIGDAAHPMVPVGSNGAGQAILDAYSLAEMLSKTSKIEDALYYFEQDRRQYTSNIVLGDRLDLPDRIIMEVDKRSNGIPFHDISKIISNEEAIKFSIPNYQNQVDAILQ